MKVEALKELAQKLALCMREDNLFTYFDSLLGFYANEPEEFLVRAMSLEKQILPLAIAERKKLLDGVSVYYLSESKSQTEIGWVDKGHCLMQYFTEAPMADSVDWENFANAVSYQSNVAGKCIRMAMHFGYVANNLSEKFKERKSLLWTAEAMLYQFADHMRDNIAVVRDHLQERDDFEDMNLWYITAGRAMMLDTEAKGKAEDKVLGCYWLVPKMDDFFRGDFGIQTSYMNPMNNVIGAPRQKYTVQTFKRKKEEKLAGHCMRVLFDDIAMAWKMVQESKEDDNTGDEEAVQGS